MGHTFRGKGKDGRREKIDSEGGRGRERWWKRESEREGEREREGKRSSRRGRGKLNR